MNEGEKDLELLTDEAVFTKEELTDLRNLAWDMYYGEKLPNKLETLSVLFAIETGLRVSELCALKHCDASGDFVLIRRMLRDQGTKCREVVPYTKGYRKRKVPLTAEAKRILRIAKEKQDDLGICTEYVFSDNKDALSHKSPGRVLSILCRELGVSHRSIHNLRKTFITALVDSGKYSPAAIAKIAGNSVKVILDNYYFNRLGDEYVSENFSDALSDLYSS